MPRFSLVVVGLTAALVSLALVPRARAQAIGGGLNVGANLAEINVSGNETLNGAFTDKFEPAFGGFLTVAMTSQAVLEINGLVSVKGSLLDVAGRLNRIRLTYIDVPILFRVAGPAASAVQLHLIAGPYVGYLVDATHEGAAGVRLDVRDAFASFDVGWVAGFGVSAGSLGFDVRYSGGVTDVARRSTGDLLALDVEPQPNAYRNRGFSLLGRVSF